MALDNKTATDASRRERRVLLRKLIKLWVTLNVSPIYSDIDRISSVLLCFFFGEKRSIKFESLIRDRGILGKWRRCAQCVGAFSPQPQRQSPTWWREEPCNVQHRRLSREEEREEKKQLYLSFWRQSAKPETIESTTIFFRFFAVLFLFFCK